MSLIRPEARAAIWRWREVLLGALVTALGANWAFTGLGLLKWLGWVVLALGLALLSAALQRARVRPRSGGVGVVELDEAQLSYLMPQGGVLVPLALVKKIEIETARGGEMIWIFTDGEGKHAHIPAAAVGAERLLDALSHFPGARYGQVVAASAAKEKNRFVIWQKETDAETRRLH